MRKSAMALTTILLIFPMFLLSQEKEVNLFPFAKDYNPERSLLQAIKNPEDYQRYPAAKMTPYQAWLSNLPLKPPGAPVVSWEGDTLTPPDSFCGVIDMPITSPEITDADVPLILLLTFFRLSGQLDKINVRFKDNVLVTYPLWLNGTYYEDAVKPPVYEEGEPRPDTDEEFEAFLDFVFRNMDNKTLRNNLKHKDARVLRPSQLFMQFSQDDADSVGHTAIILDVAQAPGKKQKLLVAYGGNPAQSIIIPRAWAGDESMWFTYEELREYLEEYGVGWYFRYTNE